MSDFAQCSSCDEFDQTPGTSGSHGFCKKLRWGVFASESCGYWGPRDTTISPEEAGLVDRKVRCENCRFSDGGPDCQLFNLLNKVAPEIFDLETKIKQLGCCNAQTPEGEKVHTDAFLYLEPREQAKP